MKSYIDFLQCKEIKDKPTGIKKDVELSPMLYEFQRDICRWALRRGRAAIFADCGMGKTPMQLEWVKHVPGRKIIVVPLVVANQTLREADKFGVDGIAYMRDDDLVTPIVITNYEMLHKFDPRNFNGIVLDESSILKSYTGKFRTYIIDEWGHVPFRLAATATPSPNDYMELGNHAEFLGAMSRADMLSNFFVHDAAKTQDWRLKGHAERDFWKWLCSWAVMIRKPSDLGYNDGEFILPELRIHQKRVETDAPLNGYLFRMEASTMIERRQARQQSVANRVEAVAELVNSSTDPWLVWCDLNNESDALTKAIPDAVDVKGSDAIDKKEERLIGFTKCEHRVLVTKPSIAGHGMNWQHCAHMAFTGLSDSYEQYYQAVRRCWRYGQKREVNCYVVTADTEGAVVKNIQRKEKHAQEMASAMIEHMHDINSENIRGIERNLKLYTPKTTVKKPAFA